MCGADSKQPRNQTKRLFLHRIIKNRPHYTRSPLSSTASLHPVPQAAGAGGFVRYCCAASATQRRRQRHIIVAAAAVVDGESARARMRLKFFASVKTHKDLDLGICKGAAAAGAATAGATAALAFFTFSLTFSCRRANGCAPCRRLSMASRLLLEDAMIICSTPALFCFMSKSAGKGDKRPLPELLALLLLPSFEGRSGSTESKSRMPE